MVGFRKAILTFALVAAGWLGVAGIAAAAPPMWVVKNDHATIYLFGTLHALNPGLKWRTPAYDAAYAKAKTVWFEADLDGADQSEIDAIMDRYGVDRDRTLSQKLTPVELRALQPLLAAGHMDLAQVDHLRPWAAAMMLAMQPMLAQGAQVSAGADMTIDRAAHGEAKQVRAFETLEDQARLFADLPEPVEVRYLDEVIHERSRPPRLALPGEHGSLEKAWVSGDLARLGAGLVGAMHDDNPGFYDVLLKRRNLAWADALATEMAGSGVELVNVGALHMVGNDGLPALMKARGFTVTRVQ